MSRQTGMLPAVGANQARLYYSLWQGDARAAAESSEHGFDVVVLCAEEWQPESRVINSTATVIYAPNCDDGSPLTRKQKDIALEAAKHVAKAVRAGQKVLVTCWMGRNRSGLVSALALCMLTGMSGRSAIRLVRSKRAHALSNPDFIDMLTTIPANRRER